MDWPHGNPGALKLFLLLGFALLMGGAVMAGKKIIPNVGSRGPDSFHGLEKKFTRLPGGTFRMGSLEGREKEQPRKVFVTSFAISRHETTVEEYAHYVNAERPLHALPHQQLVLRKDGVVLPRPGQHRFPIAYITWNEASNYCDWLSGRLNLFCGLPTEEEWEYAARGGIRGGRYPWGWNPPDGLACFDKTNAQPVASYPPNPYGLYDMSGNVFEWCSSPAGNTNPNLHFARGGSWAEKTPELLTLFRRTKFRADYHNADVGFRVVIRAEKRNPARKTRSGGHAIKAGLD